MALVKKDSDRQDELLLQIKSLVDKKIRLMVACGTQNKIIMKSGIRELLPEKLDLVSGPGCSVCVMPSGHIDAFIKVGMQPNVITAACEDLLQVRGSKMTLGDIRKKGARVESVNTPREALAIATREPDYTVVYPAVGFEANAPNVAEVILEAADMGIDNFCVIPSIRLLPPSIDKLMLDSGLNIQGLLASDNINTISNTVAYSELAQKNNLPCYIAGFTVEEILRGILNLIEQIKNGTAGVNDTAAFRFGREAKDAAQEIVDEVFFTVDTDWRGLGIIEQSGFVIRDELALYDATKRFNVRFQEGKEKSMCRCNMIISGKSLPVDCPAFGMACTPRTPLGPCMISDEGICHSLCDPQSLRIYLK